MVLLIPNASLLKSGLLRLGLLLAILQFNIESIAQKWNVTSTELKFEINNFGSSVEGRFLEVETSLLFNPSDLPSSSISSVIAVVSIDTGNKTRDKHLKGEDYFNESSYKKIVFKSTEILSTSQKGKYIVQGDLTIKNVTKGVSIPFSFEEKESTAIFSGSLNLNRLDYQVGSSSWILGEDAKITIKVSANKITE